MNWYCEITFLSLSGKEKGLKGGDVLVIFICSLKNYSRVYRSFFFYSKNIILPLKSTKLRVVDIFNIHIKLKYDFCLRKDKKKIRFVFGRIFVLSHRFFWWLQGSSGVYHSDGTSDVGLLPNLTFHRLFKWAIMSSSTWCNT